MYCVTRALAFNTPLSTALATVYDPVPLHYTELHATTALFGSRVEAEKQKAWNASAKVLRWRNLPFLGAPYVFIVVVFGRL